MNQDLIIQTIAPTTHDLGDFKVYRSLPAHDRTMVGPFIFFDQAGPAKFGIGEGIDVRPHPHINLATVTYMYEGAFQHRDSLGSDQLIEPGAVNLMTAGRGIVHSERSPQDERARASKLSAIQTWLALPDAREEMDPAFEHVGEDALPVLDYGGARARIIMGSLWGQTAPVTTYAQTIYADIMLRPGGAIPIEPEADERALYVSGGDAALDGVPLKPQHALRAAPRHPRQPLQRRRRAGDAVRRGGVHYPAPCVVELRLFDQGAPDAGARGLGGDALPAHPRRRRGVHPDSQGTTQDGELSLKSI